MRVSRLSTCMSRAISQRTRRRVALLHVRSQKGERAGDEPALDFESEGRRFDPCRAQHVFSRASVSTRPSRPKEISMANRYQDIGVARQIGSYSDAVEVPPNARWLVTAGTPGLALDGSLPKDITGQAELAWTHIVTMLARAEMTVRDLVKVTHYLLRASDIPAYVKVRARFLGDARPASMLLVVPQLVRPEFLLEVEAYAARSRARQRL